MVSPPALAKRDDVAPEACACSRQDEKSVAPSGCRTAPSTLPPLASRLFGGLLFEIVAERVVGGDEEPLLAAVLRDRLAEAVPIGPGVVGPVHGVGRALCARSAARCRRPNRSTTLFFSRAMSPTASATAELGMSTIMSTPSFSYQRRAMPVPMSGLFWWSAERTSTLRLRLLAAVILDRHLRGDDRTGPW